MTTFPKRCLSTIDKVSAQIKQAGFVEAVFRQTRPTEPFMSPLLFALFLATFAIGTTEFAIVGLLPDIAASLGASISQTGLLVSGYAIGVALAGRSLSRSRRLSRASGRSFSSAPSSSWVTCWRRLRPTMVS